MHSFSRSSFYSTLGALILLAGAFAGGLYVGTQTEGPGGTPVFAEEDAVQPDGVDLTQLWETWRVLDEKFVPATSTTPVTAEERVWGAAKGVADSYGDPHTNFLPPKETKVFEENVSGNFEGVGMQIGIRDNVITVISPLTNTPAERAGIEAGDKIVEIDGESTEGLSLQEAVQRIRGPRGSIVELTVVRDGASEPLTIPVTRDVIDIPTINTTMRDDGVFVIKLHNFSAVSPQKFRGALREFVQADTQDLVLDLRGNPGGFLQASVDIASWFLPAGTEVVTEDFGGNREPRVHRSRGYDPFNNEIDIAVLVNEGSASASEILAGALSVHGKAQLIGEETFGKGSVQELVDISGGASVKVTIARWRLPDGTFISDNGITPDVVVEQGREDAGDPQLEKAVELLKESK